MSQLLPSLGSRRPRPFPLDLMTLAKGYYRDSKRCLVGERGGEHPRAASSSAIAAQAVLRSLMLLLAAAHMHTPGFRRVGLVRVGHSSGEVL